MIPKIRDGIKIRKEEWGAILFDKWFEKPYEIDKDGLEILFLCDGTKNDQEIVEILSKRRKIKSTSIETKVREFLETLENNGIIFSMSDKRRLNMIKKLLKNGTYFSGFQDELKLNTKSPNLKRIYKPLKAPLVVAIDATSKCNLRCKYCYVEAGEPSSDEMSVEEILSLIDELASLDVFGIALTGGEPLMKERIIEIIERCMRHDISTSLTTNGTLIAKDVLKKLKNTHIDRVQVSIDSKDSEYHDSLRGYGTHKSAVKGLKRLIDSEIKYVGISTVATRLNLKDIPNLIDWADDLGVTFLRILRFIPSGRGSFLNDLELNFEEIRKLLKIVKEKNEIVDLKLSATDAFPAVLEKRPIYTCNATKTWCAIDSKGYLIPCTLMITHNTPDILDVENVRSKKFQEIWQNNKLFNELRYLTSFNEKCEICSDQKICGGGCKAYALAKTGDLFAPDPICTYDPQVFC